MKVGKWLNWTMTAILAGALFACQQTPPPGDGGPGNGDQPGDTYSKSGFVSLSESSFGGGAPTTLQVSSTVFGTGIFLAFDSPLPVPDSDDPYADLADTCFVYAEGEPVPVPNPADPREATYLDAGDAITVAAGAGVYAVMQKQVSGSTISYGTDAASPPAAPFPGAGLSVTIPGTPGASGFPAFADATFPNVAAFSLTAPADTSSIATNTSFAWPGGSSATLVTLSGSGNTAGGQVVGFYCIARDDGSFSFPAQTQADLRARGFSTGALTMAGRQGYELHRQGDAILYLSVSRSVLMAGPMSTVEP